MKRLILLSFLWVGFGAMAQEVLPVIVLDAGHGGHDGGVTHNDAHEDEKKITLDITQLVYRYLSDEYEIVFTRKTDEFVPLYERARIINSSNAVLALSIHVNSSQNKKENGVEAYIGQNANADTKKLAKGLVKKVSKEAEMKSRKVAEEKFHILKNAEIPTILLEVGFLTNEEDRTKLMDFDYKLKMAQAIVKTIKEHLKKD